MEPNDPLLPVLNCPSSGELVTYADALEDLPDKRRNEIEMHIKICRDCRFKVQWCRDRIDDVDGTV
jgi:hypothetical protein